MSLMRAGGITALVIAVLTTTALVGFAYWHNTLSAGEVFGQILLYFPISLIVSAPVALVIFPLMYQLLGLAGKPGSKLFAKVGGVIGAVVAAVALFWFRRIIALNPSIMFVVLFLSVIGSTVLGIIAGFMFERLARRIPQPLPLDRDDDVIAPLNRDDLPGGGTNLRPPRV